MGSSFVETLTSIIFLFVKHPYDVGDRISVDKIEYTVKEIRLLSTVMLDGGGCSVQAPHSVLNTKVSELGIGSVVEALNISHAVHPEHATESSDVRDVHLRRGKYTITGPGADKAY